MFGDVRPNTVRGCPVLPQVDDGRKGSVTPIPTGLRVVIKFNLPVFKVTDKRWRWEAFPLFSSFYWHCPDWHPAEKKTKNSKFLKQSFDIFNLYIWHIWHVHFVGFSISTVSTNTASQIFNALSHTRAKLTECSACMCSVTARQTFQTLTGPPSVRVDAGHISNYLFLTGLNSPRYWS